MSGDKALTARHSPKKWENMVELAGTRMSGQGRFYSPDSLARSRMGGSLFAQNGFRMKFPIWSKKSQKVEKLERITQKENTMTVFLPPR